MRISMLTFALLFLTGMAIGQQPSAVAQKVANAKASKAKFDTFTLFDVAGDVKTNKAINKGLKEGQLLKLRAQDLKTLYKNKPAALEFALPGTAKSAMRFELVRHDLLTSDFSAGSNTQKKLAGYQPGVYYHGIVKGNNNSLVAISIFDDEVVGVIHTATEGQMTLGKTTNAADATDYVIYKQADLTQLPNFDCKALETPGSAPAAKADANSKVLAKCVRAYLELDYDLVTEKGGATGAINYVTGLMNAVSTLYLNEQITLSISQIFTWTTPDSYPTTSSLDVLNAFKAARPSYNGNIAHLVLRGQPANAGIAYVDALCSPYAYGVSSIASTYAALPNFSWSVEVLTHEMGHNLGSPHTHACAWNGNNTAIDGCGPQVGSNEGCTGPIPTKGTIMSYCHMVSGVGIDFNLGFGQQPGDRIRNEVTNAACLTTCGTGGGGSCTQTVTLSGSTSICNAGTGTLTATANGTAPFTYIWSSGHTTQTISGLSGGTYSVTVTSSAGCTGIASRTITLSNSLVLNTSVVNETSVGAKNGSINLSVSGGTTPYSYKWSNGLTTEDIAGLAAGTYTVTVTAANGCTGTKSSTVTAGTGGGGSGGCTTVVPLPHTQSFEGSLGNWMQATNDGMNWTMKSGSTPTGNTGPPAAFNGSYYIYTEATGNTGKTAVLLSPCFDLKTITTPNLSFVYHMYGAQMGSLKVEISTDDGATWSQLWIQSGNKTNAWRTANISLSSYSTAKVRFRLTGTVGGDTSDLGVDFIRVMGGTN